MPPANNPNPANPAAPPPVAPAPSPQPAPAAPMPPAMDGIGTPAPTAPTPSPAPAQPAAPRVTAPPRTTPPPPPSPAAETRPSGQETQPKKKSGDSTQNTLLISEIRDGLVIMQDGSLRSVILCQSINFDLMSNDEREAVEFGYQAFLNSLYFPLQIYIRSQRINLGGYIDKLEQIHSNQDNILLGLLMEDYIEYIKYLVESANIMDKQFYIVVPYYPPAISQAGFAAGAKSFSALFRPKKGTVTINEADYKKYKDELTQRMRIVIDGLNQMNVQAVTLNTQELIELYYTTYNPQTANEQKLTDASSLETPIIEKGDGQAPKILHGEGEV